jgi:deazaflavin-dependent oxidoreductase (nitroreductase family)
MTTRRSPRVYWLLGRFATSRPVTRLHPHVHRLVGGRGFVGSNLGMLNVIVETVGRSSGRRRDIPLYAALDGERLVLIGSNAGRDREPAWVGNLRANPDVTVRVGREIRAVRAREAVGEERDRLWRVAADAYPGYDDYQRWTSRRIPVLVLEPVA